MHHHPWAGELTRLSLQLSLRVLFCVFCYEPFVIPGCDLHTPDAFPGIPSGIGLMDIVYANSPVSPCIFCGKRDFFCIASVSNCVYVPFGIPFQGNTFACFLNGDYVVRYYHSAGR